ncbi:hypothetical protein GKIL_2682 [Gloeobacter kilaueensis JS1]|uniref:Uncharacterized protein n=2 Tax=Gloeobacter TaxID=33071 RepID=U5QJ90_GLOK1|nr:hypothetical protein GKIL_2682 [Gloeobacter kilaueensis JS1]
MERFFSLTGLAFHALFLLNAATLLVPPGFLNPNWEVQTITGLINYAPLLLLGVALTGSGIYLRERAERFRVLQLYCYVLAVLFALCVPLLVVDSLRLYRDTAGQIDEQQQKTIADIDRQQNRLQSAITARSLPPGLDVAKARERIEGARLQTIKEADQARAQTRLNFGRLAVSKTLLLLVVAVLLFLLGRLSQFLAQGITLDPNVAG